MISKELLSEVLGVKCNPQFTKVALARGELAYYANSDNTMTKANFINIYELAHKCKEWAFKQGYYLPIVYCGDTIHCGISKTDKGYIWGQNSTYIENTEPEAIFKACQWILDNKE